MQEIFDCSSYPLPDDKRIAPDGHSYPFRKYDEGLNHHTVPNLVLSSMRVEIRNRCTEYERCTPCFLQMAVALSGNQQFLCFYS